MLTKICYVVDAVAIEKERISNSNVKKGELLHFDQGMVGLINEIDRHVRQND